MNSFNPFLRYMSRYLGLIVLGALSVLGIYVSWSYIWPKYQEIQAVRDEIASLQIQKEELTTYVAYLHELEVTTLPLEEELVNYALPSENDVISLIVTYEGLAKTPDIDLSPFDLSPGLIQRSTKPIDGMTGAPVIQEGVVEGGVVDEGAESTQSRELEFAMEAKTKEAETALDFIGKIHQTRRVFNIKTLLWENPDPAGTDPENITLTLDLGTYYYREKPKVTGSSALVNKGKTQGEFISKLNESTVFDALVLDTVEVGKEDMFVLGEITTKPTPQLNPTPVEDEEEAVILENLDLNVAPTGTTQFTPPSTF